MDATRCAALSRPSGKMILAVSVLICFHLTEGGLPPNSWALEKEQLYPQKKRADFPTLFLFIDLQTMYKCIALK